MKEETPKGKSQDKHAGSKPQTEEDLDFEILDALEQLEQSDEAAPHIYEQSDEGDLELENDLMIDEEHIADTEEFHVDVDTIDSDGGHLEATEALENAGLETGQEGDERHGTEDEDFSLNLDQSAEDLDISFDDEIDLDLDEKFVGPAFEEEEFSEEDDDFLTTEEEASDFDLEMFNAPAMGIEDEEEDARDAEEEDIDFENLPDLDETIAELNVSFESGEAETDEEDDTMSIDQEVEEFSGKEIISIDGDQVFDLGNEEDISSIMDADSLAWESDEKEAEDEAEADFSELAPESQEDTPVEEAAETEAEADREEEQEDFGVSFDDINIDLHDEDVEEDLDALSSDVEIEGLDLPEESDIPEGELSEEEFGTPDLAEGVDDLQEEPGFEAAPFASEEREAEEPGEAHQEVQEPEIDVRETLGLVPRLSDDDLARFEHLVVEAKTLQQYVEELEDHKPEIKTTIYRKLFKEYTNRKADIFREPEFISIRIDVEQDLEDMLRKREEVQNTITGLNDELEEIQVRHLVGEYSDDELAEHERSRKGEVDEWQQKSERLEHVILQYQNLLETEKALNPAEEEEEEEDARSEPEAPERLADTELGFDTEELAVVPEEDVTDELSSLAELEASTAIEESATSEQFSIAEEEAWSPEDIEEPEAEDTGPLEEEAVPEDSPEIEQMEDLSQEIEDMSDLAGILDSESQEDWESGDEDVELRAEGFDSEDFALGDDFSLDADLTGLDVEDFEFDEATEFEVEAEDQSQPEETAAEEKLSASDDTGEGEATAQGAEMISCKKCGRPTPASEKFCINCGAKAR